MKRCLGACKWKVKCIIQTLKGRKLDWKTEGMFAHTTFHTKKDSMSTISSASPIHILPPPTQPLTA
jgi:hypothetical protein